MGDIVFLYKVYLLYRLEIFICLKKKKIIGIGISCKMLLYGLNNLGL